MPHSFDNPPKQIIGAKFMLNNYDEMLHTSWLQYFSFINSIDNLHNWFVQQATMFQPSTIIPTIATRLTKSTTNSFLLLLDKPCHSPRTVSLECCVILVAIAKLMIRKKRNAPVCINLLWVFSEVNSSAQTSPTAIVKAQDHIQMVNITNSILILMLAVDPI